LGLARESAEKNPRLHRLRGKKKSARKKNKWSEHKNKIKNRTPQGGLGPLYGGFVVGGVLARGGGFNQGHTGEKRREIKPTKPKTRS